MTIARRDEEICVLAWAVLYRLRRIDQGAKDFARTVLRRRFSPDYRQQPCGPRQVVTPPSIHATHSTESFPVGKIEKGSKSSDRSASHRIGVVACRQLWAET